MNRLRLAFTCLLGGIVLAAIALLFTGENLACLLTAFTGHMMMLYATLNPSSQLLGPVVTRFQTGEKEI